MSRLWFIKWRLFDTNLILVPSSPLDIYWKQLKANARGVDPPHRTVVGSIVRKISKKNQYHKFPSRNKDFDGAGVLDPR